MKTVTIMGLGYIGLPLAGMLAKHGWRVQGCDINPQVVAAVNQGKTHIVEPGLAELIHEAVSAAQLSASSTPQPAEVFVLTVPTPVKNHQEPDLSAVEAAARAIAPCLHAGNLIILESTSPVGTTEKIADLLQELRPELFNSNSEAIHLAYCPERIYPGLALQELVNNDRVVGGLDPISSQLAEKFYRDFVKGKILITNSRTAEMCKLSENAYRNVNIAFANELALICEQEQIDVWELIQLANQHPRVKILNPGPGVGGHCIAVDPLFIVHRAPEAAKLINCAAQVNQLRPAQVLAKIAQASAQFSQPKIACLGLSFKANIDDLRESPALLIVEHLIKQAQHEILIAEPNLQQLPPALRQPQVKFLSASQCIAAADIVVLLVDHREFAAIEPAELEHKIIIDTRGMWRAKLLQEV